MFDCINMNNKTYLTPSCLSGTLPDLVRRENRSSEIHVNKTSRRKQKIETGIRSNSE